MTGVWRMSHDDNAETLRIARGTHTAQLEQKDYERSVTESERQLGLR